MKPLLLPVLFTLLLAGCGGAEVEQNPPPPVQEDNTNYTIHDDVPEKDERKFIDMVGQPVFLTHFPHQQKSFYMARDPENPDLTLSTDL